MKIILMDFGCVYIYVDIDPDTSFQLHCRIPVVGNYINSTALWSQLQSQPDYDVINCNVACILPLKKFVWLKCMLG